MSTKKRLTQTLFFQGSQLTRHRVLAFRVGMLWHLTHFGHPSRTCPCGFDPHLAGHRNPPNVHPGFHWRAARFASWEPGSNQTFFFQTLNVVFPCFHQKMFQEHKSNVLVHVTPWCCDPVAPATWSSPYKPFLWNESAGDTGWIFNVLCHHNQLLINFVQFCLISKSKLNLRGDGLHPSSSPDWDGNLALLWPPIITTYHCVTPPCYRSHRR